MANILTATEAANVLRCEATDVLMLDLLPAIDSYVQMATGRDWAADTTVHPSAKMAARILLVRAHSDPGALAQPATSMGWGLSACLVQLEALALQMASAGVPGEPLALVSSVPSAGYIGLAVGANLVLIFNHAMAAGAPSAVSLKDASGGAVTTTNSLDVTGKILTVDPASSLSPSSRYTLVLADVPDLYGQTLETEITFMTA